VEVLRRVGVFFMAGKRIMKKEDHEKFQWNAFCQISSPTEWVEPDIEEIEDAKKEASIAP